MTLFIEIRDVLFNALARYGAVPFVLSWFALMGMVFGVSYLVLFTPMFDDITIYRQTIARVEKHNHELEPMRAELQALEREIDVLRAKHSRVQDVLPYNDHVTVMLESAIDHGLTVESYTCQKVNNQEQIVLKLRSPFESLLKFLHNFKAGDLYTVSMKQFKDQVFATLTFVVANP